MLKKLLFTLLVYCFVEVAYSDVCPSLSDVRADKLHGWEVLNLDSAEPLSEEERHEFEAQVATFAFAEWISDAPEGAGHCFYYGAVPEPDYLGAFLAKETGEPDKRFGDWTLVGDELMLCKKSIGDCRFK